MTTRTSRMQVPHPLLHLDDAQASGRVSLSLPRGKQDREGDRDPSVDGEHKRGLTSILNNPSTRTSPSTTDLLQQSLKLPQRHRIKMPTSSTEISNPSKETGSIGLKKMRWQPLLLLPLLLLHHPRLPQRRELWKDLGHGHSRSPGQARRIFHIGSDRMCLSFFSIYRCQNPLRMAPRQ